MSKRQKVTTMGDVGPSGVGASAATSAAAAAPFDAANVRDLEALTLAAPHVDTSRLLAIIQELRQTAGVSTSRVSQSTAAAADDDDDQLLLR